MFVKTEEASQVPIKCEKIENDRRINPRFTTLSSLIQNLIAQSTRNNDSFLPPMITDDPSSVKREASFLSSGAKREDHQNLLLPGALRPEA